MGRQINFFLHQDDQPDFDQLLKAVEEDVVLLPYYHYNGNVSTVEDTIIRDSTKEGSRVYLIRKKDYKKIPLKYIANFGYWLVDDDTLPVVHFDRSVTKADRIHKGRIYFQPSFVDSKLKQWVNKPEDFVKWGDTIIRTVRRKLTAIKYPPDTLQYTEYLGANALKWKYLNKAEITGQELRSTIET